MQRCAQGGAFTFHRDRLDGENVGDGNIDVNPFNLPENAPCRRDYSKDMCPRSLEILGRTVMVPMDPRHTQQEIEDIVHNIGVAARVTFGDLGRKEAEIRNATPIDRQKFDMDGEESAQAG